MKRPKLRTVIRTAVILAAGAAVCSAMLLSLTPASQWGLAVGFGSAIGIVLASGVVAYLALARRIGRLTAVAALSVVCAAALGAAAAVSPVCPGGTSRCTSGEVGTWMLSGALLPAVWALMLLPGAAMLRLALRAVRFAWRRRYGAASGVPVRSIRTGQDGSSPGNRRGARTARTTGGQVMKRSAARKRSTT
jgi:hypothetical protein